MLYSLPTATLSRKENLKEKLACLQKGDPKVSAGTVTPVCLPCKVSDVVESLLPEAWVMQADPVSSGLL